MWELPDQDIFFFNLLFQVDAASAWEDQTGVEGVRDGKVSLNNHFLVFDHLHAPEIFFVFVLHTSVPLSACYEVTHSKT